MLDFAVKVTQAPDRCGEAEVNKLREAGYTDEDILHIAELTAIFNFNGADCQRPRPDAQPRVPRPRP